MKTRNLAAAALALGLSACSAEFSPVGIFAVCANPVPDATALTCTYAATCDAVLAGTPVLDVSPNGAQLDFRLPVQIDNALVNNADPLNGRINTNNAVISSFEMTYQGVTLQSWTVPVTVTVPAAGSASAVLRLIPLQYFPTILPPGASTVQMTVRVRGHGTLGSQDSFTTAWFSVPVSVCSGCLSRDPCPAPTVFQASCPPAAAGAQWSGQTSTPLCGSPAAP